MASTATFGRWCFASRSSDALSGSPSPPGGPTSSFLEKSRDFSGRMLPLSDPSPLGPSAPALCARSLALEPEGLRVGVHGAGRVAGGDEGAQLRGAEVRLDRRPRRLVQLQ